FFLQPRHQLDEIARPEAVVELVHQDAVPAVAAGAGRAGQREQIGAAGDPGGGPALNRRGADLFVALPAEELAEPGNLLFVDAVKRRGGEAAAGDAGAAGRDHDVDLGVGDPRPKLADDRSELVVHDLSRRDFVTGRGCAVGERVARTVVSRAARIRDGQDRDV